MERKPSMLVTVIAFIVAGVLILAVLGGIVAGVKTFARYQKRADANNKVKVTAIEIRNAQQQVKMTTALSPLDRRQLLTESQVAELFAVTPRTVRRWASAGELTPVRIGGVTRYREDEVLGVIRPHNEEARPAGNGTRSENSAKTGPTNGSYPV